MSSFTAATADSVTTSDVVTRHEVLARAVSDSITTDDFVFKAVGARVRSGTATPVSALGGVTATGARARRGMASPPPSAVGQRVRSGTLTPSLVEYPGATGARNRGGFAIPILSGPAGPGGVGGSGSGVTPFARWKFVDPVDGSMLQFAVNPGAGGSPTFARPLTNKPTTAPNGTTLVFQGEPDVRKSDIQGVLRDAASYANMITWTKKNRILSLVDDLGRSQWVVVTQFSSQRKPLRHCPDRRTYTVGYEVVG